MTPTTQPALFDLPPAPIERVTVRKGECVAMFAIIGGKVVERDLYNEAGDPCDSVGDPLVADNPKRPKGKKKSAQLAGKVANGEG